jgi:hypothetical protein
MGTLSKGCSVAIGAASDLFLAPLERVAVSGSSLWIDERDAVGATSLILAVERRNPHR